MNIRSLLFSLLSLLLLACSKSDDRQSEEADNLNHQAYMLRYVDVDSSLTMARRAMQRSAYHSDGRAEAYNHMAYVAYQQMRYGQALHLLGHVRREAKGRVEHLCADVMTMKVAQRIGQGRLFFDSRNHALHHMAKLGEKRERLSPHQQQRLHYAETEFHIVSSTYYFYLGQDSAAVAEIEAVKPLISLERDTTQWLYYHYMMGSGGLIQGDTAMVRQQEFDHLFSAYALARAHGITYFEANALQALAEMMVDTTTSAMLLRQRSDLYAYLSAEGPLALAGRSLSLFRQYRDLYQTACVLRSIGEIHFSRQDFSQALDYYKQALNLETAHERHSPYRVVPWMASIHERLSMAYSALDNKMAADHHRNVYLDLLDASRQNKEQDSRLALLDAEGRGIRLRLILFVVLLGVATVLTIAYVRRTKTSLSDDAEIMQDEERVSRLHAEEYRRGGVERRAKLSLVYSITPYLDRILAEVRRMREQGGADPERLQYVSELTDEIIRINDRLTEWIQMQRGRLNLHIVTFPLAQVLDIVRLSRHAFQQKGITLHVDDTDVKVKADKALTLFMINTLADNARKFTLEGGHVNIEVSQSDEYVEVGIRDTGIGLRPEDVETICHSKIYDSSHIGGPQGGKGFGFGIMNCKGIIAHCAQLAAPFARHYAFGVESRQGEGSRFWFRLPRVMSALLAMLLLSLAHLPASAGETYANDTPIEALPEYPAHKDATDSGALVNELYDSLFAANVEGRYDEALRYGNRALRLLVEPIDTPLAIYIHNEMAISALALHRWTDYRSHNAQCVHLHQLYCQDAMLATYCQRLEGLNAQGRVLLVLLILAAIVVAVLSILIHLRRIKNLTNEAETATGLRDKAQFEEDRLYVRNQVIDNALSTIKHETMYYPARIAQLTQRMLVAGKSDGSSLAASPCKGADGEAIPPSKDMGSIAFLEQVDELLELATYYRYLHQLLYEQAARQQQPDVRLTVVPVAPLFAAIDTTFSSMQTTQKSDLARNVKQDNPSAPRDACVLADPLLLDMLIRQLRNFSTSNATGKQLTASCSTDAQSPFLTFSVTYSGLQYNEEEVDTLFSPSSGHIPLLIVRQIIRDHDAAYGCPGLRLVAESQAEGLTIRFTLKRASSVKS